MTEAEHKKLLKKIIYGLQVAEREMLEEKVRDNKEIIVCGDDGVIRSVPAKNFL